MTAMSPEECKPASQALISTAITFILQKQVTAGPNLNLASQQWAVGFKPDSWRLAPKKKMESAESTDLPRKRFGQKNRKRPTKETCLDFYNSAGTIQRHLK